MQCPGALRRPLRDVIKSIGSLEHHSLYSHADQHGLRLTDKHRHVGVFKRAYVGKSRGNWSQAYRVSRSSEKASGPARGCEGPSPCHRSNAARHYSHGATEEKPISTSWNTRNVQEDDATALRREVPGTCRLEIRQQNCGAPNAFAKEDKAERVTVEEHNPFDTEILLPSNVFSAWKAQSWEELQESNRLESLATDTDEFVADDNRGEYHELDLSEHVEADNSLVVDQHGPLEPGLASEHDQRISSDSPPKLQDIIVEKEAALQSEYYQSVKRVQINELGRRVRKWEHQKERIPHISTDWRAILALLEKHTPTGRGVHERIVEIVHLPENVIGVFKSQANSAIVEIMHRTHCHIQIGQIFHTDSNSNGGLSRDELAFTALTLLGSKLENSAALDILPSYLRFLPAENRAQTQSLGQVTLERQLAQGQNIRKPTKMIQSHDSKQESLSPTDAEKLQSEINALTGLSSEPTIPFRMVWAKDRTMMRKDLSAFLRRPRLDSVKALSAYVESITTLLPPLVARKLRGPSARHSKSDSHHVGIVTRELLSLAADPSVVKYMSSTTVNRILSYWFRYYDTESFRKLYASLEENGYVFAASNYNMALRSPARVGDVHNFRFILSLMLKRDQIPSANTWARFHKLMCMRFPGHAELVVERMRSKNLLADTRTAHEVVLQSVALDLPAELSRGGSLANFLSVYDKKWSRHGLRDFNWLWPDVATEMIYKLLASGRISDVFNVLHAMWTRDESAVPRIYVLNALLRSALRAKDPHAAVTYLRHFRVGDQGSFAPGSATYIALYELAWECQCYNMLRVIWRYACAAGHVLPEMRLKTFVSARSLPPQPTADNDISRHQLWRFWAGKFAVGVDQGLQSKRGTRTREVLPRPLPDDGIPIQRIDPFPGTPISAMPGAIVAFEKASAKEGGQSESPSRLRTFRVALTDKERRILHLSGRCPQNKNEYTERDEEMKRIGGEDLNEVMSLRPTRALHSILDDAWRMDVEWGKNNPESIPEIDHGRLAEMMVQGIIVPMKVGDATGSRPRELPWKKGLSRTTSK